MNRDFVAGAVVASVGLVGLLALASMGGTQMEAIAEVSMSAETMKADTMAAETMASETMSQETMGQEVMAQHGGGSVNLSDARLAVPDSNYRVDWVQLGTFSVQADDPEEGAGQLHVVYAERAALEAYLKDGAFPDGTKLVKDVYAAKTEDLTTGRASYADTLAGRFVMVKDADNSEAGSSPLWGEGWGWAFYEGDEKLNTVTTNYVNDCLGCHQPAAETDYLYVQGYPLLK